MSKKKAKHAVASRSSAVLPVLICAVVALALAAGGFALVSARHRTKSGSQARSHLSSGPTSSTGPGTTDPPAPLRVVAITPKDGSHAVGFGTDVTVSFSAPVENNGVLPKLTPAPPGSWSWATPDKLVFHPNGYFAPYSRVRISVPGGSGGFSSKQGASLHQTVKSSFAVKAPSVLRLQQLLAELGYLPVRFVPSSSTDGTASSTTASTKGAKTTGFTIPPGPPLDGVTPVVSAPPPQLTTVDEPTAASQVPLTPVAGSFAWRFSHIPSSLAALWAPGKPNTVTAGAVMQFELAAGLQTDGQAGRLVWRDLLQAVAHRQINRAPYDYVWVSEGSPEYVAVWRDGTVVFETLANTGIPEAPTEVGTWPVYARYLTTTMSGTNPDGTKYSDPGIPWVSYFNGGDALHGFLRASYGFPQSLGCVEMPYSSAETVFPYTPIGTLVTVL